MLLTSGDDDDGDYTNASEMDQPYTNATYMKRHSDGANMSDEADHCKSIMHHLLIWIFALFTCSNLGLI